MTANPPSPGLLRRCALGLWLCGIAALGAVEFVRAAFVDGSFAPALVGWLWLVGSVTCAIVGIALLVREVAGVRSGSETHRRD
ncbi:MAG TPA: hypothetical protein VIP76_02555 [Luteimonas sp.]|jgi:hypothetical protein